MVQALKKEPSVFASIDFIYTEAVIHILVFAFSDDHQSLENIIYTLVNACNRYGDKVKEAQFITLLDTLVV
jgi:hypothetical protein